MKHYCVSRDTTTETIMGQLTMAVEGVVKNEPVSLFPKKRSEHLVSRLRHFMHVSELLANARCSTMHLCILYEGKSFYKATRLEVQLTDKKDSVVYSATTFDHE